MGVGDLERAVSGRLRGSVLALGIAAAVLSLATPPPALADVPPFVGIAITFERGCPQGAGTLETINATLGPVVTVVTEIYRIPTETFRRPVLWGRDGKLRSVYQGAGEAFYPIHTGADYLDRGDRVVVRLLSADSRLLFTSDVPYFPEPLMQPRDGEWHVAPEYLLAVRLDCSRIPYRVAAQIPWPFFEQSVLPPTSTAPAPPESPPVPLILVATFGLALIGGWRYLSNRRAG